MKASKVKMTDKYVPAGIDSAGRIVYDWVWDIHIQVQKPVEHITVATVINRNSPD